jgi:hypothetical protein
MLQIAQQQHAAFMASSIFLMLRLVWSVLPVYTSVQQDCHVAL